MNGFVHGGSDLVSIQITTVLDLKKSVLAKRKVASFELPAPGFSCLIQSLKPVLVTKFTRVQQKSREELLK